MNKNQNFPCLNCGALFQMQNVKPGDQFILCCPTCGQSTEVGIGSNIKPDAGYQQPAATKDKGW